MRTVIAELVRAAASTLLAHQAAGRQCEPRSVQWAHEVLNANPDAAPARAADDSRPKEATSAAQPF